MGAVGIVQFLLMAPGGLQSVGYRGLPDLAAVMRAGVTGMPEVSQADVVDSDNATAQTIARMVDLIKESCGDPLFQRVAQSSLTWSGGSGDARSIAAGCWWAVKHMMRFVQDSGALYLLVGPHDALELLVSPAAMVRARQMQGDCDDFTMMVCAMLQCLGVPFEILTVAASPQDPSRFSHVYARAVMPDGSRIPLDASHGKYPGWEVPKSRQFRLQVWDMDGNAVSDDARSTWDGLHGYVEQPALESFRGFGHLGACGDCLAYDENEDCTSYDTTGCDSSPVTTTPITITSGDPIVTTLPVAGTGSTCESSYQSECPAGSTWIPATNPFTGGAAVNAAGQYVGANGQPVSSAAAAVASIIGSIGKAFGAATTTTICNSAGVCTTAPAGSNPTVAATGIPTSWLLVGGVALFAILALGGKK